MNLTLSSVSSAPLFSAPARRLPLLLACGLALPGPAAHGAELHASDGAAVDFFGAASGLSGSNGIVGAHAWNSSRGAAYVFRNAGAASGVSMESVKLLASDREQGDQFGEGLGLSGNIAIVGAPGDDVGNAVDRGSAYLFRDLDSATGSSPATETARLTASDGTLRSYFGASVSLSGNAGLIGAYFAKSGTTLECGAAYLFRDLHTATATAAGTIPQTAKLTASDRARGDRFGYSVSLSGDKGLIGAHLAAVEVGARQGVAYLFRDLATATGTIPQTAKLTASDGGDGDGFGFSCGLSGNSGIVGAYQDQLGADTGRGSAYFFRELDTATGSITEKAKLISSDGKKDDWFGYSCSLSGNTGIVGAFAGKGAVDERDGSVYLFRDLDRATGTIMENVKILGSKDAAMELPGLKDQFGGSVVLEGDRFVIGAATGSGAGIDTGSAYTGRVSAFTTLDEGGASRTTDRLSFISREDWVIGGSTDGNQNTLSAGDTGTVSTAGKAVYVGRAAGADHNALTVDGTLTANSVQVGAAGNTGNALRVSNGGTVTTSGGVTAAAGSSVGGDGTLTGDLTLASGALFAFLPSATLTVTGSVALPSGFGVTGLLGLDGGTPAGTYPLIDGTATNFATLGLSHWGQSNAHSFGGGKTAWFQQQGAGLQLVVAGTGTGTVELPALNISWSGGQLTLTWTTSLTGLIPETSPTLTGNWQAVTTAPVQSGNTWTLTVPISENRRFYRLRRP